MVTDDSTPRTQEIAPIAVMQATQRYKVAADAAREAEDALLAAIAQQWQGQTLPPDALALTYAAFVGIARRGDAPARWDRVIGKGTAAACAALHDADLTLSRMRAGTPAPGSFA